MFKKWNRILAFLLSIALVTTTFGSDFASAKVYAEENEIVEDLEEQSDEEPGEEDEEEPGGENGGQSSISEISFSEEIPQGEPGDGDGDGDETETSGDEVIVSDADQNGETGDDTSAETDPDDESIYELDEDGNVILDENGNPKLKEKPAEEETKEEEIEADEKEDGIKIYYVVADEDAGYVDNDSDVFAEGKKIVGSTAFENDGYAFINWTDEDGNEVSDEPNFTPAASDLGVSEDSENEESEEGEEEVTEVTFTANFEAVSYKEVVREVEMDGVLITFSAEPGVLPNDAQFNVERVYPNVADDIAADLETELNENLSEEDQVVVEVKDTISFDINIYAESLISEENPDGHIELDGNDKVKVTFENVSEAMPSAADKVTELAVYHVDGSDVEHQTSETPKGEDGIEFVAEHFSTYTIAVTVTDNKNKKITIKPLIVDENHNEIPGITDTLSMPFDKKKGKTISVEDVKAKAKDITTSAGTFTFEKAQIKIWERGWFSSGYNYYDVTGYQISNNGNSIAAKYNNTEKTLDNSNLVFVYKPTSMNYTVAVVDTDGEEFKESVIVSVDLNSSDLSGFNNPARDYTVDGVKYNYVKTQVYAYSNWNDVRGDIYKSGNTIYAPYYKSGYNEPVTSSNLRFVYEAAVTFYDVKVVENNYYTQLADAVRIVIDGSELTKLQNPTKFITTESGDKYEYEKTEVYSDDYRSWYNVVRFEKNGSGIDAKFYNGGYTQKVKKNNLRFVYKPVTTLSIKVVDRKDGHELTDPKKFYIDGDFSVSQLQDLDESLDGGYRLFGPEANIYGYWLHVDGYTKNGSNIVASVSAKLDDGSTYTNTVTVDSDNLRFVYGNTGEHLDLGFHDQGEFNIYKKAFDEGKARIIAEVNGVEHDMEPGPYGAHDEEMHTWEFRLSSENNGGRFNLDDKIIFKVVYTENGQTYYVDATEENGSAFDACIGSHRGQTDYGFDYDFTFEDQFEVEGNLKYHKNDGSTTMPVGRSDSGQQGSVTVFTFTVEDMSVVGKEFTSGPDHEEGAAAWQFAGWKEKGSDKIWKAGDVIEVEKGKTRDLYAVWVPNKYTVSFDLNRHGNEEPPKDQSISYNGTVTKPADPSDDNYEFIGWYTESSCQNAWDFENGKITENRTLYAKWEGRECTVTYLDGFNKTPDDKIAVINANYGDKNTPTIDNPTTRRPYYEFKGWYVDDPEQVIQKADIYNTSVTGDITYTAKWERTIPEEGTVKITAKAGSQTYDGSKLYADYEVTGSDLVGKVGSGKRFQVKVTYKTAGNNKYKDVAVEDDGKKLSITDAGTANYEIATYQIIDTQKNNANVTDYFKPVVTAANTLTVEQVVINVRTGTNETFVFDGTKHYEYTLYINDNKATLDTDHYATVKPVGFGKPAAGETLKIRTESYRILPGSEDNKDVVVLYENDAKERNYKINWTYGKIKVNLAGANLKITADSDTFTYDGDTHKVGTYTTTFPSNYIVKASMTSDSFVKEFTSADKNVASITKTNEIDKSTVRIYEKNSEGTLVVDGINVIDVTEDFKTNGQFTDISFETGTLTLDKRAITVKSGDAKREYNGKPLQNTDTPTVTGELDKYHKNNLSAIVTFDNFASITKVGKIENTYDHNETELAVNYTITYLNGELEVYASTREVEIVARDDEKFYDGSALTVADVEKKYGKSYAVINEESVLFNGDYVKAETKTDKNIVNVDDVATGNHKFVSYGIYRVIDGKEVEVTSSYKKVTATPGTLTIKPVAIHIWTAGGDKPYDGTPLTSQWLIDNGKITAPDTKVKGLVNNETATIAATGKQLNVGKSNNTYKLKRDGSADINWDAGVKASNYIHDTANDEFGILEVTTDKSTVVSLKAKSSAKLYDGSVLTNEAVELTGIDNNKFEVRNVTFTVVSGENQANAASAQASVGRKDKGSVSYKVNSYELYDKANKMVVTDYFTNVEKPEGTITVYPRTIYITAASGSKPYDGLALTGAWLVENKETTKVTEEVTVTYPDVVTWPEGDADAKIYPQTYGFVNGQGFATLSSVGEVTYKSEGTIANTPSYTLNDATKADNYKIVPTNGELWITDRPENEKIQIEVVANSREEFYSGQPWTVSGLKNTEYTYNGRKYIVRDLDASVTQTNVNATVSKDEDGKETVTVNSYPVNITGNEKVYVVKADGTEEDVTDQFKVTKTPGTLLIKRKDVTLTSISAEKEYDGTPLDADWIVADTEAYGAYTNDQQLVTADGFEAGEGATYKFTGSQLRAGFSANAFSYELNLNEGSLATNYNITKTEGTLTVQNRNAKFEVSVQANSDIVKYNGRGQEVTGFESAKYGNKTFTVGNDDELWFELSKGQRYTIEGLSATSTTENGKPTDVLINNGEVEAYPVSVSGTYVVKDSEGIDVTEQFNVTANPGELLIERREVTLTSYDGEKPYDGTVLDNNWIKKDKGYTDDVIESWPDDQECGFVDGQGVNITFAETAKVTRPGEEEFNEFTYEAANQETKLSNYSITPEYGILTITSVPGQYKVKLKAVSEARLYTGSEITISGFESEYKGVKFTEENGKYKFTAENGLVYYISGIKANGAGTNVAHKGENSSALASYTVNAWKENCVVEDAAGKPVTSEFEVTLDTGLLTIVPRRVVFTSAGGSKDYDGTPLTSAWLVEHDENVTEEVTVSFPETFEWDEKTFSQDKAFADGQSVSFNVTGVQSVPGKSSKNTFDVIWNNAKPGNYVWDKKEGELSLKNRSKLYEITVKAKSDNTLIYLGRGQDVTGFENENLVFEVDGHNYKVENIEATSGKQTHAGTYTVQIKHKNLLNQKAVVREIGEDGKLGQDVTDQFTVNEVPGEMVINPRTIILTSQDLSKEYDGIPLDDQWIRSNYKLDDVIKQTGDGFAPETNREGFESITFTGSVTRPNEFPQNTFTWEFNSKTDRNDYIVDPHYGTLSVTDRKAPFEVTVVANSNVELYDGTYKTASGIKEVQYGDSVFKPLADGTLTFDIKGNKYTIEGLTTNEVKEKDVLLDGDNETAVGNINISGQALVRDKEQKDVTKQFSIKPESGTLTITRRKVTLKAGDAEKDFDGKPLKSATYSIVTGEGINGFAEHDDINEKTGITVKVKGSQTVPGDSDNLIDSVSFDEEIAKASNYIVTKQKGTLTVKSLSPDKLIKLFVTVNLDNEGANEVTRLYDGKEHKASVDVDVTHDGSVQETVDENGQIIVIEEDDDDQPVVAIDEKDLAKSVLDKVLSIGTITAHAADDEIETTVVYGGVSFKVSGIKIREAVGVDVGDYEIKIDLSNVQILLNDEPVTNQFDKISVITPAGATGEEVVGILHITPRHVVLTSESASKTYDGTALTRPNVAVGGDGFVAGEVMDLRANGSITEVGGPVTNTISYKFNPEKGQKYIDDPSLFTKNYVIESRPGTLSITAAPADDDDDDTPSGGGTTTIPDAPVALAPAPAGAVLGAQRGVEGGDGPAVLGARRAGTDDETNRMARVFAMVAAAAIAVTMLITGKKKDEEEEG